MAGIDEFCVILKDAVEDNDGDVYTKTSTSTGNSRTFGVTYEGKRFRIDVTEELWSFEREKQE